MNTTSRITIPVDETFRRKLGEKADDLGFDSVQAMFRYIGKALIDGRKVDFGEDDWQPWPEPPKHVLERWERESKDFEKEVAAGNVPSFSNAGDLMKHLNSL